MPTDLDLHFLQRKGICRTGLIAHKVLQDKFFLMIEKHFTFNIYCPFVTNIHVHFLLLYFMYFILMSLILKCIKHIVISDKIFCLPDSHWGEWTHLVHFPPFFLTRETTFMTSYMLSYITGTFWNGVYSKRKNLFPLVYSERKDIAPKGSKFFPFRREQKNFYKVVSLESVSSTLKVVTCPLCSSR